MAFFGEGSLPDREPLAPLPRRTEVDMDEARPRVKAEAEEPDLPRVRRDEGPPGAVEEDLSGRRRIWSDRVTFDDRTEKQHHGRRQLLEVHAMAVSSAWIFMLSSPLRMSLASPWSVCAVPCAPSTRHRWRV